jgi:beta-fructofuranosidase
MVEEFFESPMATRREMAGDFHRPLFHFLPPRNWMNDPNGLIYWQGKYHLFYQFNPYGALWGFIHWGHASSSDLIHWTDHPIALTPDPDSGDENGCFSGCMVVDQNTPTAVYTGFVNFVDTPVMIAKAEDPDLIRWQKSPHNPVIQTKPSIVGDTDFRDPYVWREGGIWKAVIGAGLRDGSGAVLLYESEDLKTWEYRGVLFQDDAIETVRMWECPNFFQLGDQYVLLVSLFPNIQGVYYYVGDYDGQRFDPKQEGWLDSGGIFYAPQVRCFDEERVLMFAWLLEGRSDEAIDDAGWAGVQALPRVLSLDEDLRLVSQPLAEVNQLRRAAVISKNIAIRKGEHHLLEVSGRQMEIHAEVVRSEGLFELHVLATSDGSETTVIGCDFSQGECFLDTTKSSLSEDVKTAVQRLSIPGGLGDLVDLHVFVDGSVVEVWINHAYSLTGRAYPTREDAVEVGLSANLDEIQVRRLEVWPLEAVWPQPGKGKADV